MTKEQIARHIHVEEVLKLIKQGNYKKAEDLIRRRVEQNDKENLQELRQRVCIR